MLIGQTIGHINVWSFHNDEVNLIATSKCIDKPQRIDSLSHVWVDQWKPIEREVNHVSWYWRFASNTRVMTSGIYSAQ